MIFTPTTIAGCFLIELEPRPDSRGFFVRAFCKKELAQHGLTLDIVQCNFQRTLKAGVIRGMHYRMDPAREAKMVRCYTGAVYDALVDMRPDSPTYRAVYGTRLTAEHGQSLFVPGGVAHGYQALEDGAEVLYMVDEYYEAGGERGVRFSDPKLGVEWPLPPRDVTERDATWPLLD